MCKGAGFLFVFIPLLRSFSAGPASAVLPVSSPSPCSSCAFGMLCPLCVPVMAVSPMGRLRRFCGRDTPRLRERTVFPVEVVLDDVFQILHDGLLVNSLTVIAGDVLTLSQMAPMGVLVIEPDLIFSLPDEPPPADGRRASISPSRSTHCIPLWLQKDSICVRVCPYRMPSGEHRSQAVRPRAAASALPKSGFHCR